MLQDKTFALCTSDFRTNPKGINFIRVNLSDLFLFAHINVFFSLIIRVQGLHASSVNIRQCIITDSERFHMVYKKV